MPAFSIEHGANVWPTTIDELEPAERLVVLSFRRFVLGHSGRHRHLRMRIQHELFASLGNGDGEMALVFLGRLVRCLRGHARRAFSLHAPCYPGLGVDEAWVVCLVAACQNGQPHLARALARWMIKPSAYDDLMHVSIGFARILRRNAVTLSLRVDPATPGPRAIWPHAQSATIH